MKIKNKKIDDRETNEKNMNFSDIIDGYDTLKECKFNNTGYSKLETSNSDLSTSIGTNTSLNNNLYNKNEIPIRKKHLYSKQYNIKNISEETLNITNKQFSEKIQNTSTEIDNLFLKIENKNSDKNFNFNCNKSNTNSFNSDSIKLSISINFSDEKLNENDLSTYINTLKNIIQVNAEKNNKMDINLEHKIYEMSLTSKITLKDYLKRIAKYIELTKNKLIYMLAIMDRILICKDLVLSDTNVFKLVSMTCLITDKMLEDDMFAFSGYTEVFGIKNKKLIDMELYTLNLIDFRTHINLKTFSQYRYYFDNIDVDNED